MSEFLDLQAAIVARLKAVVSDIPAPVPANGEVQWITEIIGDLKNIIDRNLGKLGVIGIVMTPGGRLIQPGVAPISLRCPIEVQIQESVTINRSGAGTQIAALDLVRFTMKRLHWWAPQISPATPRITRIELDEAPYLLVAEYPILTYNVRFNAPLTIL
jgi:hypothetical protein